MENLDDKINEVLKIKCEESFEFFVKYMFFEYNNRKFMIKPFHREMFDTIAKVVSGEITRLVINIPPRHGKTELMNLLICWIYAKNPSARNLIISYSSDRASKSSEAIRNYILSEPFQRLWDVQLKSDNKGKSNWVTTEEGEVLAASSGGQITGFGAGTHGMGFESGVILMDDPLKPEDSNHETAREGVNNNFVQTIASRANGPTIPFILIMQRLHEDDLAGFLLNGGDGFEWHHLNIPVWREDKEVIFPEAFSQSQAEALNRSNPWIFAGQYLQEPAPLEGGIWKMDWFETVSKAEIPTWGIKWNMFIDGAYTKDTSKDPTGILISGYHRPTKTLYVLHNEGKHLEMPQLLNHVESLCGALDVSLVLAEPKASGKSIVQMLRARGVSAREIKSRWASKSKLEKANDCAPYIEGGRVKIVKGDWNQAYLKEVCTFPNAKHDECVDNTSYAIERNMMRKQVKVY